MHDGLWRKKNVCVFIGITCSYRCMACGFTNASRIKMIACRQISCLLIYNIKSPYKEKVTKFNSEHSPSVFRLVQAKTPRAHANVVFSKNTGVNVHIFPSSYMPRRPRRDRPWRLVDI